MANQAFIELCSKVYDGVATDIELNEFQEAMQAIKAKGASPSAIWELNQIIVKQAQKIVTPRMNFLDYVAEVQRVGHGQKMEFVVPKGKMKMKWSARGTTVDYQRVGHSTKYSAEPVKIQGGAYYEYDQLLSGTATDFRNVVNMLADDMEKKIVAKGLSVLHTKMASSPTVNRWSGAGVALTNFNSITGVIQRYNPNVTTICDIDFAKKLTALIGNDAMSDAMKDFKHQNGVFTTINGVDVVTFANPFEDETNTSLVAPRKYAYALPSGINPNMKPLKIGFEGEMYQLTDMDIDSERVFLKVGQKIAVDMFDTYYVGEFEDTTLA